MILEVLRSNLLSKKIKIGCCKPLGTKVHQVEGWIKLSAHIAYNMSKKQSFQTSRP